MEIKSKILIVDDNTENLSVLGNMLLQHKYSVQVAENGKQAIQMAQKKDPELILLDINMPGMSGFDVIKELKENDQTRAIPVIFLTAHAGTDSLVEGFSLGAVDYITKPFSEEELLLRVKNHLELKKAKDDLVKKNKELEALNSTKDKLFSIIAHDLRNPIGLMMNVFEFLPGSAGDEEKLEFIMNSNKQLAHSTYFLLDNLLNWARHNMQQIEFKPSPLQMNGLIDEILNTVKFQAEQKGVQLEKNYNSDYTVIADENMLKLVIRNLLTNAIKFTPNNGSVSITVATEGNLVKISIHDTGVGMTAETIKQILTDDQYYTTMGTDNEPGSGLGLKLVRSFVEMNNSRFLIESEPNKGSTFSFFLPFSS